MKTVIFLLGTLLLVATTTVVAADITTVKAVQGNDVDYFDYADSELRNGQTIPVGEVEFLPGCNWYCGGYVKKVSASAEMPSEGEITYHAQNAHDFDKDTAWVPKKGDRGIGAQLRYEFNFDNENEYEGNRGVTTILLANGYKKSRELWEANSRVRKMRLSVNGKPYRDILLLDSFEVQTIDIGKVMFPPRKTTTLEFEILEVYPGKKYKETAISELVFDGVGVH